MNILQRGDRSEPRGSVRVVDPNPLNWLYVTYNTVEEPVRVTRQGKVRPAAMTRYRWVDDHTLELTMRDERFADGSALDAESFRRAFAEQVRWQSPHPPGTHFNIDRGTRAEVVDDRTVRLHLPRVDGLALGKLRATHVMTERFWRDLGFGYARDQSGEGHWWIIDAPGPWASGPFTLVEGRSLVHTEPVVTDGEDRTWLQTEDRSPVVRLQANEHYWDRSRGPHLQEVEFRNDLSREEGLDRVCDGVGEVDIVTEVPHAMARRVRRSRHAKLVTVDAVRALAGVLDPRGRGRAAARPAGPPRAEPRDRPPRPGPGPVRRPRAAARRPHPAHAADRAAPRPGPAAPAPVRPGRGRPAVGGRRGHGAAAAVGDDGRVGGRRARGGGPAARRARGGRRRDGAARGAAAGGATRPGREGAAGLGRPAARAGQPDRRRAAAGAAPGVRRAVGGVPGGPVDARFEQLFANLVAQTSQLRQVLASNRIDRYVRQQSLALFLVAPQVLYAVNRHVDFVPYATSFELAETSVRRGHWSVR